MLWPRHCLTGEKTGLGANAAMLTAEMGYCGVAGIYVPNGTRTNAIPVIGKRPLMTKSSGCLNTSGYLQNRHRGRPRGALRAASTKVEPSGPINYYSSLSVIGRVYLPACYRTLVAQNPILIS